MTRDRKVRDWVGRVVAVMVVAVALVPVPSVLAGDGDPVVSWVATGDSYSSGQGLSGDGGPCAQFDQEPAAYGPLTRRTLVESGWTIDEFAFSACTGHMVEDLFVRRSDDKGSLWEWAGEQGVPGRVDVITMSFGGNDIGFADIIKNCLVVQAPSWSAVVAGIGIGTSIIGQSATNCDLSLNELEQRAKALLDPPITGCTGGRGETQTVKGEDRYKCDLWITGDEGSQVRGSIADFYRYIVDERLTDRGKLVVVGYPSLFAPTSEWAIRNTFMCKGVTRGDAEKLTNAAIELDRTLKAAVERADNGEGRIRYISAYSRYRAGANELCGTGEDWLNGPTYNPPLDLADSFHPNALGYINTAQQLTAQLRNTDWPHIELRSGGLGPVDFGSDGQRAINYVTPLVGAPDSDTKYDFVPLAKPWQSYSSGDYYAFGDRPDGAYRSFVTPYVRETCWRDELCLILGSDTGQEWVFMGWDFYVSQVDVDEDRSKLGARTAEGISPGMTLGEIVERYPNIEVDQVDTEAWEITFPGWERASATFYFFPAEYYEADSIPASYFDPSIPLSSLMAGIQMSINIG